MNQITPWCYRTDEGVFVDHSWIEDTETPVCTKCGVRLDAWRKAMAPIPPPDVLPEDQEKGL